MSLGLSKAGISVIGALDSWSPAVRTYRLNFEHPIVDEDVRKCDPEDLLRALGAARGEIDLVTGGPPCQGFSIQRIGVDEDERNDLIFEFGRLVLALRPRVFLMENVKGLLGSRGRYFAVRLKEMLSRGGYAVESKIVNAAEYGVPQVRKRVFVYGRRNDQPAPFVFPEPELSPDRFVTVTNAIGDLPSPPVDYSPALGDQLHRRMRLSELNLKRLTHIPPGGGFEDLPVELRVNAHKNGADKIGHRYVYGRLDPDKPAGTITARFDSFTRGRFAHPHEDRNITLREGARLQTFPDDFKFEGTQEEIAALIGNAVPPLLAEKIGNAVAGYLRGEHSLESLFGPLFSKSA